MEYKEISTPLGNTYRIRPLSALEFLEYMDITNEKEATKYLLLHCVDPAPNLGEMPAADMLYLTLKITEISGLTEKFFHEIEKITGKSVLEATRRVMPINRRKTK